MRTSIFALILAVGLLGAPMAAGSLIAADLSVAQAQQQPPPPQPPPSGELHVDITTDQGGAWYTEPVWIAIGVLALLIIVAIIIAAGRGGGGTTVVRG